MVLKCLGVLRLFYHSFVYLSIKKLRKPSHLVNLNLSLTLTQMKETLDRWSGISLSLWHKINVIKMNITLRLIYILKGLPIIILSHYFKQIYMLLNNFLQEAHPRRLPLHKLQLSVGKHKLYYLPCQTYYWEFI